MNLNQIELRHLRYFLAVADAAHFTRAAAKLHVTQPILSHQIRQLEDQLNLQLFDRVGRRVKLTAAGETLLPHARKVLSELDQAQAALGELHGLKQGLLRVGIVQTVNTCVIPEIVARFSAEHGSFSRPSQRRSQRLRLEPLYRPIVASSTQTDVSSAFVQGR